MPNRSFTCDVKTPIAAPVVNPDTSASDSNDDNTPNRTKYMII